MKKEITKITIECLIVFIIAFVYNSFIYNTYDHIWDFMHSYSISKGLLIYKDFNIVVGPVYPVFMSLFLKIFGGNLLVFDIVNSLIVACIYLIIRINNKKTLALFAISCYIICVAGKYNVFTLIPFYIIFYADKNNYKHKNLLIGFLLAILTFTKISIGCSLILATVIINIKDLKSLFKRAVSFTIASSLIIIIMISKGIFLEFINYTILGLFEFSSNYFITAYILLLILFAIYILLNVKKDKYLFYMFFYLIMAYPLFNEYHVFMATFPALVYFIDNLKQKKYTRPIMIVFSLLLITLMYVINILYHADNRIDLKKKCINDNCFLSGNLYYIFNIIHNINSSIKNQDKYQVFYILDEAYMFKYDLHENINKYDLLLKGNMGYNGTPTYIEEISKKCSNHKCMFIVNGNKYKYNIQFPMGIRNYVMSEYNKIDQIRYKEVEIYVYTND